jgi:hypothetical protein
MGAALAGSGYRQIRLTAKTGVATASAVLLTSTPQKYCTMRLTHSTAFPAGVTPNFIWSFVNSSGRTRSAFSAFVNGSGTGTPLTSQTSGGFPNAVVANQGAAYSYTPGPQHFVNGNPAPPVGCATATLGTVTDPLCFGGTGSAVIDLSTSTDGTYVVDGGAAQSFTGVSSFTVSGLSQGAHTIDVTPQGCSTPTTFNVTIGGPSANGTNTTSATACDTYTWSVNGQTYTTSGTYTGTSTDANGCTVDETLNLTINASTSNTTSATACDTYTWSVDGMTYTTSGTYTSTSTKPSWLSSR